MTSILPDLDISQLKVPHEQPEWAAYEKLGVDDVQIGGKAFGGGVVISGNEQNLHGYCCGAYVLEPQGDTVHGQAVPASRK